MARKVLVTGAGCLGKVLVRKLLDGGADVVAVDRSAGALDALDDGARKLAADVTDPDAIGPAVAGRELVFHTAALLDGPPADQLRVNVEGTRTVAEAAAAAGVERLVHVSSNAVYGIAQRGDLTEDRGPDPSGQAYSQSKATAEAVVRKVGAESQLEYSIIRPAGIFGPGAEYFTAAFFRRAGRRPIVFVGKGSGSQAVIFVDDVADLAIITATHPAAAGEAFNCAIDPPPTVREYIHAYGDLTGNRSWLGIPMPLVKAASWLAVPFARRATYARELPANLSFVDSYVRYPMDKARRLLDWEPRVSVSEGVRRSISWLREKGLYDEHHPSG